MRSVTLPLLAALLAASCSPGPPLPAGEQIGEEMVPREALAFAVVDADPERYLNRTLLVEATAAAVCAKKGCWMQVEDDGRTALVRWETGCDGKYAFPEDATGRRILIQGSFYAKQLTEEDAQHMEEEASEELVLERDGYEFNASAVLLLAE